MRVNGNTRSVDARVGRGLLTPGTVRPKMGVTWYGVGGLSPSTPLKAGTAGLGMLPFKGQTGGAPAVLARAVFSTSWFYFAVYLSLLNLAVLCLLHGSVPALEAQDPPRREPCQQYTVGVSISLAVLARCPRRRNKLMRR